MSNENYLPHWLDHNEFDRAEKEHHRLWLRRLLKEAARPEALLVMCNPSDASECFNDPTIDSVERIFTHNGYGKVSVVNLFTKREPSPRHLDCGAPRSNDAYADFVLQQAFEENEIIVFAWGVGSEVRNRPAYRRRAARVEEMASNVGRTPLCLGVSKGGFPLHPLYRRADTPLIPLSEARRRQRR